MRFKTKSNPYSKFTPEQRIMGDKAEDLGYTWDRVKYPTPAWGITIDRVSYGKQQFNIPIKIWNRELRLWSADCAERLLPIWEDWAWVYLPEHLNSPRLAINAAREFAYNRINKLELEEYKHAVKVAIRAAHAGDYGALCAANAAYYASSWAVTDVSISEVIGVVIHFFVVSEDDFNLKKEQEWQKEALAQRIDAVAPWRLK